jgi:hypothetical protein
MFHKEGHVTLSTFLNDRWGWCAIERLPDVDLTVVSHRNTPAGFQLSNAGLMSGGCLTILKDADDHYYTAWGEFIPFRDWEQHRQWDDYTKYGVFTNPKVLHSDLIETD